MRMPSYEGTPRVLIVGGGFGGVAAAKALRNTTLPGHADRPRNYYLCPAIAVSGRNRRLSPPTLPVLSAASFGISQTFASCSAA